MGLQTLFVPALISLVVYILYTYVVGPFIRRQRQYASYTPLQSASVSASAFRSRLSSAIMVLLLPSTWGLLPQQWVTRDNSTLQTGQDVDILSDIESLSGDEEQTIGLEDHSQR
jgi:hypothetical protein